MYSIYSNKVCSPLRQRADNDDDPFFAVDKLVSFFLQLCGLTGIYVVGFIIDSTIRKPAESSINSLIRVLLSSSSSTAYLPQNHGSSIARHSVTCPRLLASLIQPANHPAGAISQVQTPAQRRANEKFAKHEASKRGKSEAAFKQQTKLKSPISNTWIRTSFASI